MKFWSCTLILTLAITVSLRIIPPAYGNPYPSGLADTAYVYRDGYYWQGERAYTRAWYQPPFTYGYHGGCYQGYWPQGYYTYTYSHTLQRPQVSYTDPGWRSKLLDIAAQRDKVEGDIRRGVFEQAYFSAAVKQLGLEGNFHWQGYGVVPPYGAAPILGYPSLTLSAAGVQGSTIYGYHGGATYNSIASVYGDANLAQLYQQANRLAENAQRLSGQATTDFSALVGAEGGNRAKVAEILAKSQAVQELLKGLGDGVKVENRQFTFELKQTPQGMQLQRIEPQAAPGGNRRALWEAHAKEACGGCHGGGKKQGGFELAEWVPEMKPERRMAVLSRLLTDDAAKLMPRAADGGVGKKLAPAQLELWLAP